MTLSESHQTWTDEQLTDAVAASHSWRGVLRQLGLSPTSTTSIRLVKRHAARLDLDTSHFTGQRSWSDSDLKCAAASALTWGELFHALGISWRSKGDRTRLKAHAIRLGVDLSKFDARSMVLASRAVETPEADIANLREAATAVAVAWFALRGCGCALPMEPATHDLLVSMPDGIRRVQVKTTTHYGRAGWQVSVGRRPYSIGNNDRLIPYDPEQIDLFFILDGDLNIYLIPQRCHSGPCRDTAARIQEPYRRQRGRPHEPVMTRGTG